MPGYRQNSAAKNLSIIVPPPPPYLTTNPSMADLGLGHPSTLSPVALQPPHAQPFARPREGIFKVKRDRFSSIRSSYSMPPASPISAVPEKHHVLHEVPLFDHEPFYSTPFTSISTSVSASLSSKERVFMWMTVLLASSTFFLAYLLWFLPHGPAAMPMSRPGSLNVPMKPAMQIFPVYNGNDAMPSLAGLSRIIRPDSAAYKEIELSEESLSFTMIWTKPASAAAGVRLLKSVLMYSSAAVQFHIICDKRDQKTVQSLAGQIQRPNQPVEIKLYDLTSTVIDADDYNEVAQVLGSGVKRTMVLDPHSLFISDPAPVWKQTALRHDAPVTRLGSGVAFIHPPAFTSALGSVRVQSSQYQEPDWSVSACLPVDDVLEATMIVDESASESIGSQVTFHTPEATRLIRFDCQSPVRVWQTAADWHDAAPWRSLNRGNEFLTLTSL